MTGVKKMSESKVSYGIIGVGSMGSAHSNFIFNSSECELKALCDIDPQAQNRLAPSIRESVKFYTDEDEFFADENIEAVLIAVPHYFHVDLAIKAMQHNKHIIVEKPIAVHKLDAERLLREAEKYPHLVKSAMFCQRTLPAHIKLNQLIDQNELGRIQRINWVVTNWFRTQYYYDSGDWRASWRGEGGGVLLNQCPHQLDLMQWLFGMPNYVSAAVKLVKYHKIEVEDEINAYFEYADGKSANFISSTGEAPGINRLEIIGERGLLTMENGKLTLLRNEVSSGEYIRTADSGFSSPAVWRCEIPVPAAAPNHGVGHLPIIENTAKAIRGKAELIAPMEEGIRGLELGNAILYSGLKRTAVELPLDSMAYAEMLDKLIESSSWQPKKAVKKDNGGDFSASFNVK